MDDDEDLTRAELRVGMTLREKYRLDRVLGIGGMAVVYAATHRNRKRFAVKMLHPELSRRQSLRERFVREGYLANTVEHPNALAVLDDDVSEDGAAFVVMELLDGATLEDLARKHGNKLPPRVVLAATHQLLDVLAAAHNKSIVHRDVKPANVFVLHDGTIKVLDFGIARLREAGDKSASQTNNMMLGTPAFLPPEQARGKSGDMDNRTDIWAVGATMFTTLSGAYVHTTDSPAELVVVAATEHARSVRAVVPDLPEQIVKIVDRALAFAKDARWASAEQMQNEIADAYRALYGTPIAKDVIAEAMKGMSATVTQPFAPAAVTAPQATVRMESLGPSNLGMIPPSSPRPLHDALATSTAKPVQMSASEASSQVDAPKRSGVVRVLAVGGAVALVALAALLIVPRVLARPPSVVVTTPPQASSGPTPIESASAIASAADPTPAATVSAEPSARHATASGVPTKPTAVATTVHPPATATKPTSKPVNCKPPFEVDAQGNKHWKPECI